MTWYQYHGEWIPERPLEPPENWFEDGEEEEEDTEDLENDDDHGYIIGGGKVIRYE